MRLDTLFATITLVSACASQAEHIAPALVSVRVGNAPVLDGNGGDAAWRAAIPLQAVCRGVFGKGKKETLPVMIRSVHAEGRIYLLVAWDDKTKSVTHKTWVWDGDKREYAQGGDREDMLSLGFEHTGAFDPDMLAGIESVWDVWHWKACRTDPQGFATDKTHCYTRRRPAGKAREFTARDGKKIWIARPEDAGVSVENKQPRPVAFKGDRVPQYSPGKPKGSSADVRAKGVWKDGRWTVELSRSLVTGHADDTTFDPQRAYRMAVALFDHTGKMDKSSDAIVLSFARHVITKGFESETVGAVPAGFSTVTTGNGAPGAFVVRAVAGGGKVVVQTSDEPTNRRFPLLVYDDLLARDVDVSVRFKSISGRVDQAAGVVWRYADKDNYYVVRANALEDNVVLYKVEKGKRDDLQVKGVADASYGMDVKVPAHRWNSLRVVVRDKLFQVYLNGRYLFAVDDATFTRPGKVGLWTKADSVMEFDDLVVSKLDPVKK